LRNAEALTILEDSSWNKAKNLNFIFENIEKQNNLTSFIFE